MISSELREILEKNGNSSLVRFISKIKEIPEWMLVALDAIAKMVVGNRENIEVLREKIKALEKEVKQLKKQQSDFAKY